MIAGFKALPAARVRTIGSGPKLSSGIDGRSMAPRIISMKRAIGDLRAESRSSITSALPRNSHCPQDADHATIQSFPVGRSAGSHFQRVIGTTAATRWTLGSE